MRTQYAARPWPELHLEEKFNVDLRPWYDIDVYDSDSIRVRLATGDIPDYLGGFNPAYVDLGIVRELPQDLIRTHMPGYMRWADHYLGDEVWRRTMVDGVNYTVPAALSMASTGQVIGFRGDWMQNLGYELEPVPGTDFFAGPDSLDEIEQLLLAFRNEDPDGNGRKDSYGYAVWKNNDAFQRTILPSVFGAYGVQLNVWDVRDGTGYYSMVDANYRDALKYITSWWENEIIPEHAYHGAPGRAAGDGQQRVRRLVGTGCVDVEQRRRTLGRLPGGQPGRPDRLLGHSGRA